ncbi:UNVERIFIED_CONTAM: hypothetical protein RF648_06800 [Kocuria sp. CPCC 205274]
MFPARPVRAGTVLAAGVLVVLTACGRGGPDDGAEPASGSPTAEQTIEQGSDRSAQTSDGSTDLPGAEPGSEDAAGPGRGGSDRGRSDGAAPDGAAPDSGTGGEGNGGARPGGGSGGVGSTPAPPRVAPVIGGLPIGPVGPGEPGWYVVLRAGTCDYDSLAGASAQDAASLLCQAGVTNDEALWSRGAAALAAAPLPQSCHDVAAVAMLQRLVQFHRDHPEDVPVLVDTPGTACPLSITGLATAPDEAGESALPVPPCGGVPVHLRGNVQDRALPVGSVQFVTVGPTPVPIQWASTGPFFVAPPAPIPEAGGSLPVALSGSGYVLEDPALSTVALDYAPGTTACPAPGS